MSKAIIRMVINTGCKLVAIFLSYSEVTKLAYFVHQICAGKNGQLVVCFRSDF